MKTLFFTSADQKYECFIAPYAAAVLTHNPDAGLEIAVENAERAAADHAASLAVLERHFPGRLSLRSADFNRCLPNTVRFITEPMNRCEYTYIGDIDIIVLDHVTPMHLGNMAATGLPYSNALRKGFDALTGLHFTRTDAYYPIRLDPSWNLRENDEKLLYKIVSAAGHRMPENSFRPVHGLHLSVNRRPIGEAGGWGIVEQDIIRFQKLRNTDLWRELEPVFHPRFVLLLVMLQVSADATFPGLSVDQDARIRFVSLSRRLFGML